MASGMPGVSRWHTAMVASGVCRVECMPLESLV